MDQITSNLNRLVDKKIELFEEILQITLRQKSDIEGNAAENIQALVDQKQAIINRIDEIDAAFSQLFAALKKALNIESLESIDAAKHPQLVDLKGKVKIVMSIAGEIMELEKTNMDKLNELFNSVKSELKQLKSGKRTINAYEANPAMTDGVYIDRKK